MAGTMNLKSFGLTGVASTDLGLGAELKTQTEEEILKRKKKSAMPAENPLGSSAAMSLLGPAAAGAQ